MSFISETQPSVIDANYDLSVYKENERKYPLIFFKPNIRHSIPSTATHNYIV